MPARIRTHLASPPLPFAHIDQHRPWPVAAAFQFIGHILQYPFDAFAVEKIAKRQDHDIPLPANPVAAVRSELNHRPPPRQAIILPTGPEVRYG